MGELLPHSVAPSREQQKPVESELKGGSLDRLQSHFIDLYGRRNEIFLPGRDPRIDFLYMAIGDLQDAGRKEADISHMEQMHARIVSRTFCIANGINDVSIGYAMSEKYPQEFCAYCQRFPCICSQRRAEVVLQAPSEDQKQWGIHKWQQHLGKMYGEKNNKLGMEYINNRLFKEIAELKGLEKQVERGLLTNLDHIEHEYATELADTLAWTIASANFHGVNLEDSLLKKYGKGCGKCGQMPCQCGPHSFEQIRA